MAQLPLGLQPYADQIISVAGKTIAIGSLVYVSQEDLFSAAFATVTSNAVAANTSVRLFQLKPGETGQGWTAGVDSFVTNNENGDRFQGNEIYLATGIGFEFMASTGSTSFQALPLTSVEDVQTLGNTFNWALQIGSGPERIKGKLAKYPFGSGPYQAAALTMATGATINSATADYAGYGVSNGGPNVPMRRFDSPLVFPPNIDVKISIKNGAAATLVKSRVDHVGGAAVGGVVVIGYMMGFRMTLPA